MPIHIIVPKKKEKYFMIRNKSQIARSFVSKENRQEYDNEKRAKEINAKMAASCADYNAVAVAKMMNVSEQQAKKMIKARTKGMVLDGKID